MIEISKHLTLRPIEPNDQQQLYILMQNIYPPVYQHLWADGGQSYLEQCYNQQALDKDLSEQDTLYCFVLYKSERVGMIRLLMNSPNAHFENQKAAKLQRIYLGDTAQGKGIGKLLMVWMEGQVKKSGAEIFWLEVMDTQTEAIGFYEYLGFQKFNSVKFPSETMHERYNGMYQMWKKV